ncbi:hypothetical protein PLICRDRAFT_47753 [Plicaturopsis crispa FD-325 SS-3]|nr:hypothetical protein PLICRDRAFT_47753 [Plicaturopsis crispa FD-325 SS-3]
MSLIARAPRVLLRQQAAVRAPVRNMSSGHGEYHHLPFAWPGQKKAKFGAKVTVLLATGFGLPFFAAYLQLRKSGGAA